MAPKKATSSVKVKTKPVHVDKDPSYMVQIPEARMLRKDLLEGVREIIIFMQGYEKFRKIQEEKVALFVKLRGELRDLNRMTEEHLKKALPRGKLKVVEPAKPKPEKMEAPVKVKPNIPPPQPEPKPLSELEELELQLQDIENQLRNTN